MDDPEDVVAPGGIGVNGAAERIASDGDTDVLLYNGPIERSFDDRIIKLCRARRRRKNLLLVLVTEGGDADAAYRIAKFLQSSYERFTLFVTGYCKSAGTMVALGANELVFGDHGELGPLDVQMSKQDSLWDTQSGLTVNASLAALQDKAYLAFETFFLETEAKSQGLITVKTASDMATSLTIGLFGPLYAQIDPIHVGEAARAMQIADHYGRRLMAYSKNFDQDSLRHLITHYPSHGFVIDHDEASTIFENVRKPTEQEVELTETLREVSIEPLPRANPQIRFLSQEKPLEQKEVENGHPENTKSATPAPTGHNGPQQTHPRPTALRSLAESGGEHS